MARTPIMKALKDAASLAAEASRRNLPVEEMLAERAERTLTRRDFLKSAAFYSAVVAVPSMVWNMGNSLAHAETNEKIVIVGAGLAGLTCAYRLKQSGIHADVYEASTRVGGRCWTRRKDFDDNQIGEHGGELIDQSHTSFRQLAKEFNLDLDNLLRAEVNGTEALYYFNGSPYSYTEATNDIKEIWQKIHSDVSNASYPTLYNQYTDRGYELDHMSITDWINETVPDGMNSKLGKLLDVAYNIEYGGESIDQSSLNLLYLLGYHGQGNLTIFGPSNEKFHIRGGNDLLTDKLAEAIDGQIQTSKELIAIRRNSDGRYTLTFQSHYSTTDVTADRVVLTLPFSILRSSVEYSQAGFQSLKKTAIQEYGMGTNSKLFVQFRDRHWESLGSNGETYSETGYQNSWDVSRAQSGKSGLLVNYTGGTIGNSFGRGTPSSRAETFLQQIEPVLPGLTDKWNGKAEIDYWPDYEWTKGSYSYYKVGQFTKFAGVERETEGNCYFAGEHTSIDFQGYLNGAVESGERAATDIVSALSKLAKRN